MSSYNENDIKQRNTNHEVVSDTFVDTKAGSVYSGSDNVEKNPDEEKAQGDFIKSEAEKRLVRKINCTLLPFVGAIVFIQVRSDFAVMILTFYFSLLINLH